MKIKQLHPNLRLPCRATDGSAGYDLCMPEAGYADHSTGCNLLPLGFAMAIPEGYGAFIIVRSSSGRNDGLRLANGTGLIDWDYRGQWFVSLETLRDRACNWGAGQRLLQMTVQPVLTSELQLVDELDDTVRGAGGFGSTGS